MSSGSNASCLRRTTPMKTMQRPCASSMALRLRSRSASSYRMGMPSGCLDGPERQRRADRVPASMHGHCERRIGDQTFFVAPEQQDGGSGDERKKSQDQENL